MPFLSILGPLDPRRFFGRNALHGKILALGRFQDVIERERSRTDRTGIPFSLVVFRLAGRKRDTYRTFHHLIGLLRSRIRLTDDIGWVGKTAIGAVLFGTGEAAAKQFGEMILDAMPSHLPRPRQDVYVYPVSRAGTGDTENERGGGSRCEGELVPSAEQDPADTVGGNRMEDSTDVLPKYFVRQLPLWKDILDVVAGVVALTLLSPLFLLVAAYIKIVSPGPVFYRQERVGFRGKPFTIWKFRTMKIDNDATTHKEHLTSLIQEGDKEMVKLDDARDPRIIPLGWVLRQTGIDELPQLFNVVLGDMSLVGPRPCLPYEAKEYDTWHSERFDTIPGLTGLWQVSGKNRTTFRQMMRYDIRYTHKMSVALEFQILLKTFSAIYQQIRDHRSKTGPRAATNPLQSGKEAP